MADLLKIIHAPYDRICINIQCDKRIPLPRRVKIRAGLLSLCRTLFFVGCGVLIGANISLRVHAQTLAERTAKQEVHTALLETRMDTVEKRQDHTDSEVSTMNGEAIGIAAAMGFLQVLQIVLGKRGA